MCEMGPAVLLWLLATCLLVDAFYLPSLAPTNFCEERVSLESRGKCKVSPEIMAVEICFLYRTYYSGPSLI